MVGITTPMVGSGNDDFTVFIARCGGETGGFDGELMATDGNGWGDNRDYNSNGNTKHEDDNSDDGAGEAGDGGPVT